MASDDTAALVAENWRQCAEQEPHNNCIFCDNARAIERLTRERDEARMICENQRLAGADNYLQAAADQTERAEKVEAEYARLRSLCKEWESLVERAMMCGTNQSAFTILHEGSAIASALQETTDGE